MRNTYNAEGNITSVDSGGTAQYVYNALNQRVKATAGSAATEYVFSAAGQRVSEWSVTPRAQLKGKYYWGGGPVAFYTTAASGEGVPALLAELGSRLRPIREFIELSVPHEQAGVIARLHEVGQVVERNYNGKTARFKARIPPHLHEEFAPFVVRELQTA